MSHLLTERGEETYWRTVPHPFIPANWGRQYCQLCADPKRRAIHVDRESLSFDDPRRHSGDERATGLWSQTWWKVEGWNSDGGGSTCYGFDHRTGPMLTKDAAEGYIAHLVEHGDDRGTRFQHYAVVEFRHYSVCTSLVHQVLDATPDARGQEG